MKPNFSFFGIPENGLGVLFFRKQLHMDKEIQRIRQTQKCLLSRGNGKRQPAKVENGGKIMVTSSLLPFTFHVNVMPNLSFFPYYS